MGNTLHDAVVLCQGGRDTLEMLADFCTQSEHETYAVVYPALQSEVVGVVDVVINHE